MEAVFTYQLNLNWELLSLISRIDRFDGAWQGIERNEGTTLKALKSIATVQSVGSSTRIEGSNMDNSQVEALIASLDITKLQDRDEQEVAGYFEVLDQIGASFQDIAITENDLKNLHNLQLRHSTKDEWHRGNYKQLPNAVEATHPDGSKEVIFDTTPPGVETEDAIRNLMEWHEEETSVHPLVRTALFCYEFVTIHPFQDGNGRMSRLLSTLLLLKANYKWIQYVSFEHEIELRKAEYYQVLIQCQQQRPGEDVGTWVHFFLDCLANLTAKLLKKLETKGAIANLGERHKNIYKFVENNPGCQSGTITRQLGMALPTVKKDLEQLFKKGLISRHGKGRGTNYSI